MHSQNAVEEAKDEAATRDLRFFRRAGRTSRGGGGHSGRRYDIVVRRSQTRSGEELWTRGDDPLQGSSIDLRAAPLLHNTNCQSRCRMV